MENRTVPGKFIPDKTNSKNNIKGINKNPLRKCPFCAEKSKAEAIVCCYRGRDLINKATTKCKPNTKILWHYILLLESVLLLNLLVAILTFKC